MASVSPEAVRQCQENGITVIPGSCPNQFLKTDIGYAIIRVMWQAVGFMKVD